MSWLDSLPWWIRVLFIVGEPLMSASSNSFPIWFQTAGLWVGVIFTSVGLLALPWHFYRTAIAARRGNKNMKPPDLIVLGLGGLAFFAIVTLGGFIWQQYRLAPSVVGTQATIKWLPASIAATRFVPPTITGHDAVAEFLRTELLKGDLIARGFRHQAVPRDQEPTEIAAGWWSTLRLVGASFENATNGNPTSAYDAVEIAKPLSSK